jgi:chaperonin cofactor prefoldin
MSVGDWFTLKPLNLTNYQPQINELNSRVSTLETRLTSLQQQVDSMNFQILDLQIMINAQGALIQNLSNQVNQINNNVTTLTDTANQLNNSVNSMSTSINDIVNLYKPIAWFDFRNVNFTDFSGNTANGNFSGAWYRPIKLLEGGNNNGVDLKFMLLVLRGITINNIPNNGRFFFSD